MSPVSKSIVTTSPCFIPLSPMPGAMTSGKALFTAFLKYIAPADSTTSAPTPSARKQSTACWRLEPHPKFAPAITMSPGRTFSGKSRHPSRFPKA